MNQGIKNFIPHRLRRQNNKPIWSNRNFSKLSRLKSRRWKTYQKYRTAENLNLYKNAETQCENAIRNAKKQYERKLSTNRNVRQFNANVKAETNTRTTVGPLKVNGKIITDD